jgi:hypothetical protein
LVREKKKEAREPLIRSFSFFLSKYLDEDDIYYRLRFTSASRPVHSF